MTDFQHQANLLRSRLLARGYSRSLLRKAFNKAKNRSRNELLYTKKARPQDSTVKLITRFSAHYQDLYSILSKHWHFLVEDPILKKYVNPHPGIVYKRTVSLKDRLVSNQYKTSNLTPLHEPRGTKPCGNCSFCPWISSEYPILLPSGETCYPKFSASCQTQGVVYLMTCTCGVFYVGKTARQLRQRINDHVYYSGNGKMLTPVSRHLDLHHRFDTSSISFTVLAVVPKNPRGGEWDRLILQKESLWIERLNAIKAPGLNESHSYKPFL